jgi:rhodanese-related sulfurtransferase
MAIDQNQIRANREYFVHKLQAEKQRNTVLNAVEGTVPYDFLLLDTRGREAFAAGHIPGAWCVSDSELDNNLSRLPKDKEIVTYCWGHD